MNYLLAVLIFLAITTVTWFVAVAIYQSLLGGPDLRHDANFVGATCASILLVTLVTPVPFPAGYLLSLVVWWLAAKNFLVLTLPRAVALILILAGLSFLSRLAILGVLNY
jgi:hypothetical protein